MDALVKELRVDFRKVPEHRGKNITHKMDDVLMSAYAMFALKHPSLNDFEQQSKPEKENLKRVFGIGKCCSDAQMRTVLDEVPPGQLDCVFERHFQLLRKVGIAKEYRFDGKQLIVAVDGVQFFRSEKVHCACCCTKKHRDGRISYGHSMLAATLVHPDRREVFPLSAEIIQRQDGAQKNDCERNAAKRLLDKLSEQYRGQPLLITEDALYGNAPHIAQILDNQWDYVIGVKPDSHKGLFNQLAARRRNGTAGKFTVTKGKVTHRFYWVNNTPLNDSTSVRVNFLLYEQEQGGKTTTFSWVTSLPLNAHTVEKVMRVGRARWKIENETFNTLKNQGYHFEHNYGHGYKHLSNTLALLMLTAFLIDQLVQACDRWFQKIWAALKTKSKFWAGVRALFLAEVFNSFKELYLRLASLYEVQLE